MFKQTKMLSEKCKKLNELNKLRAVKSRPKSIVLVIKTPKEKWTRSKIVNGIQGKDQGSVVGHLQKKTTITTDLNLLPINPLLGNLILRNLRPVNQLQVNLLPINPLSLKPLPTNPLPMNLCQTQVLQKFQKFPFLQTSFPLLTKKTTTTAHGSHQQTVQFQERRSQTPSHLQLKTNQITAHG